MPSALSQLILDVENMDRSMSFYVDFLRLQVESDARMDGVRLVSLQAGSAQVLLMQREGQHTTFDRSGGIVLNFEVRSLNHIMEDLAQRGWTVIRGLEKSRDGEASILVADPDGYAVLLSHRTRLVH